MNKTERITFSAIMSALGVVVLYLGSVINILDLTAVAIASFFVFFAVMELGTPYQYLIYALTATVSLILLPDKFGGVAYFLFGGIYPIIKEKLERLGKVLSWILKLIYFNLVLSGLIFVSTYILKIDSSEIVFSVMIYFLGNITFVLYDFATTLIITAYIVKYRKKLKIEKYFRQSYRKIGSNIDKPKQK